MLHSNAPHPSVSAARSLQRAVGLAALATVLLMPGLALAQIGEAGEKVCGFFENINALLNAASVVVVTISVIFSGYQIAFAHKRIADVASPLIGGVLIGAAAQVAKMVVGEGGSSGTKACSPSGAFLMDAVDAAIRLLAFHA